MPGRLAQHEYLWVLNTAHPRSGIPARIVKGHGASVQPGNGNATNLCAELKAEFEKLSRRWLSSDLNAEAADATKTLTALAMPTEHQSAVNAAKELKGRRTGAVEGENRDARNLCLKLRRLMAENPTAFFRNTDTHRNGGLSYEEWEQACTDALGKRGLGQDHFAELRSMIREMTNKGAILLDEFRQLISGCNA